MKLIDSKSKLHYRFAFKKTLLLLAFNRNDKEYEWMMRIKFIYTWITYNAHMNDIKLYFWYRVQNKWRTNKRKLYSHQSCLANYHLYRKWKWLWNSWKFSFDRYEYKEEQRRYRIKNGLENCQLTSVNSLVDIERWFLCETFQANFALKRTFSSVDTLKYARKKAKKREKNVKWKQKKKRENITNRKLLMLRGGSTHQRPSERERKKTFFLSV